MALRALASKLRIPAALRQTPASRSAHPQDMVGSTASPKPAEGGNPFPLYEMLMEQQLYAFEKRLKRNLLLANIAGGLLGMSGGFYCVRRLMDY
uniref:Uncharacterized protein n=1 Tax=Oryza brachyantha TaxID=4533 RepID=J3MIJ8_ORYBR